MNWCTREMLAVLLLGTIDLTLSFEFVVIMPSKRKPLDNISRAYDGL